MTQLLLNIWNMLLAAAPWLVIGLFAAALIKAFVPTHWIARAMGGKGVGAVVRGSLIGIPLPLCSCGVLPTALGLRRQGASKSATSSFLISTPEIGVESFSMSFALLGPFMAIVRPIAAFLTALSAGLASRFVESADEPETQVASGSAPESCCSGEKSKQVQEASASGASCCGASPVKQEASCCSSASPASPPAASGCCSSQAAASEASCCGSDGDTDQGEPAGPMARLGAGLYYVSTRLMDDVAFWLAVAIVLAGVVMTIFPDPERLAEVGSGLPAMLVMLVIGVPLYVCATASTPLAASLLAAGVSPGTVLVFLLAGPATNIGSIGVLRKELGWPILLIYLASIAVCSVAIGLVVDLIAARWDINAAASAQHAHELMPLWFSVPTSILVVFLMIRPLRRWAFGLFERRTSSTGASQTSDSCCSETGPSPQPDAS